ncbi:tyrosine-protein phosphatase [Cetobacterium sp.]|uniref:tyrosine-protein phosphatase n=2 Tax=Cetobacterium sp. TaxID=2071632 RepID=UPI00260369A6|nr:CpsB/CapC family capsule biosynthesis tyrosine phosphatase [uncultured Cetobacterium sp.]
MVDIHTHLLFGVDDGPKTVEESIEMIRDGMKLGFNEFYLTSHYNKGRFCNENYDENYKILQKKCEELKLGVKLHKGNEVYLDENIEKVLKEKKFNVIKRKFLLVEFSPLTPVSVGESCLKKVLKAGFVPILAHVERYGNFRGSDLVRLRKLGVKLQVNIGGEKPRHIVRLLKEGFIDFLGSDAHGVEKRGYTAGEELKYMKKMTTFNEIKEEDKGNEKKQPANGVFNSFFRSLLTGIKFGGDS